jgi:NAD(P)-dependent dehydrogenase (short-subunit alcohol dehydrogenase family)
MKNLNQRVAVVTGAASGIGQALAHEFAAAGCRLALSDVNEPGLRETAEELRRKGHDVLSTALDVSERNSVFDFAEQVMNHFGEVHIVVNNAGVALGATVEDMTYEDMEWLMGINFWGVVHGTKAFLPYLKQSDEGHIVNVSSVFGLVGIPTQSAYNAAKFAVRGFTESLRQELDMDGDAVSCTCIHPGGIKTNIARNARMKDVSSVMGSADPDENIANFEKLFRTTPGDAAHAIIRGIRGDRRRVLIGSDAQMIDRMQRSMPTLYQRLIATGQKFMGQLS